MLEERVRQNLYKLINQYYKILKKRYKKTEYSYKIEKVPSELKQSLLNYETSIFKYIENKRITFSELFKINQECVYSLSPFETELLRNYIGVFDDGKKQTIEEVSKRLNITKNRASNALKEIMDNFESELGQLLLIKERNKEIKNKIFNKEFRKQILNSDITFLNITDNFIEILRLENINTVKDLLEITEDQVEKMNIQYGYYPELRIIPNRLIEEVHNIGLRFEDEIMISQMQHDDRGITINPKTQICESFDTLKDAISARQFEPELLSRLNLSDYLSIDRKINECYMQEKIMDMNEKTTEYDEKLRKEKEKGLSKRFRRTHLERNN